MSDIVIVAAKRTAVGRFLGGFNSLKAHELGAAVISNIIQSTQLEAAQVSEVILGQVLTAGHGMNPARQASLGANLPITTPAWGMNQVCGSGLRAVALAAQAIATGDSDIVIAGGQESMSNAPHAAHLRDGLKMGDGTLIDTMVYDGLTDIFNGYHMGVTAENVAKEYDIGREAQDEFAANSQAKYQAALKEDQFADEIVPVTIKHRKGDIIIDTDEHPRADTTVESLSSLRPAFDKAGTVTAGNASGINDGAAAVMLMTREMAEMHGLTPLASVKSWAQAGVDPKVMGTGPVPATQKALAKAGWTHEELDLIESNEAFAAQALSVDKLMGWDTDKVNVNGGSIAIGHPIGASGCRILVTLLHEMARRDVQKGLATLCIGGGMGIAMCVERQN